MEFQKWRGTVLFIRNFCSGEERGSSQETETILGSIRRNVMQRIREWTGELRSYVGQEGDSQESSISKKALPPPGLKGWGEDGVTRVQKLSHMTGSRTTMER